MANKKLSATITIGGAVASSLKSAFGSVKGGVNEVGSALRAAEKQQRLLTKAINREGWSGIGNLEKKLKAATERTEQLRASFKRLRDIQGRQSANLEARSEYRGQIFDAVALGATVAAPVVMAANFETAMLGVAKQVDGARDSGGKLTSVYYDMQKQIQKLGREIPIATNEIADMVTAGARMGVARDQLIGFTRTTAMMATAFELPAGELADSMGKIAGLFKIPIPAIGELADSINYLDDNAISKGGDIIDFMTRTGGVAGAIKITAKEMAALGSTLLTLGDRSETASTATNAMFQKFSAASKGSKKFKAALKEVGLSAEAVQKGMQIDATGTMLKVLEAIRKLPSDARSGVMTELVGLEHSDTLAKLVNGIEEYKKQLALANGEAAKGSMSREYFAMLETTTAQWTLMKNIVSEVAVNLGSVLLPVVNDTFKAITPAFVAVADFARENPEFTKAIVGTTVALVGLKISAMGVGYAFTFVKGAHLGVKGFLEKIRAGAVLAGKALPLVGFGIRGISLAFAATGIGALISGVALAGLAVYRHWGGVSSFMGGVFDGISVGLEPLVETLNGLGAALDITDKVTALWQGFNKLLEPIIYTKNELNNATAAGKKFGVVLGKAINGALLPIRSLIDSITFVINQLSSIGTIDTSGPIASPRPDNLVPALPSIATARGGRGGAAYYDHSQNSFPIYQQPGENQAALAKRIADENDRRRAVRQRSMMTDGVIAQ